MPLPEDVGFYPPLPDGTLVPARGFGIEGGGHVYFGRLGVSRLGAGGSFAWIRGTTDQTAASARLISSQFSFNFGTADGWSYVGGGVGAARVEGRFTGDVEEASRRSDTLLAMNIGGGARWFVNAHLGIGFDLRVHHLPGQDAKVGVSGTPSSWLLLASAGLSLK
jgi:opacity protein-like surface antigen